MRYIIYSLAWLTQVIAKKTRFKQTVVNNIKKVLPQGDAEQIAEKLIENTSYSIFELLCLPFFKPQHFQSIISIEGIKNLENALMAGKGAILLTMHAGNYEIIAPTLAKEGFKMTTILRATKDRFFNLVNRSRAVGGVKLVNVLDQNMYIEAAKALAKNECVFLLADTGALESRHEYYKFLGREVPVATGWLTLAQRTGAKVLPVLSRKTGPKNIITIHAPIEVGKDNRDEVMLRVGSVFENFIQNNPEQWAMFLNSFETNRMVKGG